MTRLYKVGGWIFYVLNGNTICQGRILMPPSSRALVWYIFLYIRTNIIYQPKYLALPAIQSLIIVQLASIIVQLTSIIVQLTSIIVLQQKKRKKEKVKKVKKGWYYPGDEGDVFTKTIPGVDRISMESFVPIDPQAARKIEFDHCAVGVDHCAVYVDHCEIDVDHCFAAKKEKRKSKKS